MGKINKVKIKYKNKYPNFKNNYKAFVTEI